MLAQATLKAKLKIHVDLGKPPSKENTWSAEPNTIRSVTDRWISKLTVSETLSQKEEQHLIDYRGLFSPEKTHAAFFAVRALLVARISCQRPGHSNQQLKQRNCVRGLMFPPLPAPNFVMAEMCKASRAEAKNELCSHSQKKRH